MLPCPGICLFFNFSPITINGHPCPDVSIVGLHEDVHKLEGVTDSINTLIIQCTPWGFHALTSTPIHRFNNAVVHATEAFGESILTLYVALRDALQQHDRTQLLDQYFLAQLKPVDAGYTAIAQIAGHLRTHPEPTSFAKIQGVSALPLGTRQMARRFKDIIGSDLQSYIRMCRFGLAKQLLFEDQDLSMTEVAYRAGYYDQAHFSKDFKTLSGTRASDFIPRCAFQNMEQPTKS